jgi:hypothetical protein
MAVLHSSRRTLERATYVPMRRPRRPTLRIPDRAWEKWGFLAALAPSRIELDRVAARLARGGGLTDAEQERLAGLAGLVSSDDRATPASLSIESAPRLRDVPSELLLRVAGALADVRAEDLANAEADRAKLLGAFQGAAAAPAAAAGDAQAPPGFTRDSSFFRPGLTGAAVFRRSDSRPLAAPPRVAPAAVAGRPARPLLSSTVSEAIMLARPSPVRAAPARAVTPSSDATLIAWARDRGVLLEEAERLAGLSRRLAGEDVHLTSRQVKQVAALEVARLRDLAHYFRDRSSNEPVGLLHLERLSFLPAGIERGELMYSVPLTPAEEITLSHKEWSHTSEEFHRIVTDFLEEFSEEGVAEKSELAQSTSSQQQHSIGFNMSVTASGSYGPVSVSASTGFNLSESSSRSQQTSRNHSQELTRRASARSRREHKVSFKVATTTGTEQQAMRRIRNPFSDKATRADFYQLVRKWRVDLHRYGLRLTYDLTIPEPGGDILTKVVEINELRAALQQGFGADEASLSWARFDLTPDQIDRENYDILSAEYGVAIEPPPPATLSIVRAFNQNFSTEEETENFRYFNFEIDVPEDYEVTAVGTDLNRWYWDEDEKFTDIRTNFDNWIGASGHLTLTVGCRALWSFDIQMAMSTALKASAFAAWQMRAWGMLREAAQNRYELNRSMLKDRMAKLQEELGGQDPLSLRKIEREEVMKNVLRWLFGPSFDFSPEGLPSNLYGPGGEVLHKTQWSKVLAQGEVIKFLHHAIEWENMTYFLYPYFWSHPERWELKKYMQHPDLMHRSFLKAGSARVVLTIRPGFEVDFVTFLESGSFGDPPSDSPYVTIAQEIESYARTNYPGIRAANPVEGARPLLTPRQLKVWGEMERTIGMLEQFRAATHRYPSTEEGLAALAPFGPPPAADPWGRALIYRAPGVVADFELACLGADGVEGGEGEDADITSWAEVSLIGQWYDYTPTSALDVAFGETLPSA